MFSHLENPDSFQYDRVSVTQSERFWSNPVFYINNKIELIVNHSYHHLWQYTVWLKIFFINLLRHVWKAPLRFQAMVLKTFTKFLNMFFLSVSTFVWTSVRERLVYASGRYGDLVWDGYRILIYNNGWACTHLTERWRVTLNYEVTTHLAIQIT